MRDVLRAPGQLEDHRAVPEVERVRDDAHHRQRPPVEDLREEAALALEREHARADGDDGGAPAQRVDVADHDRGRPQRERGEQPVARRAGQPPARHLQVAAQQREAHAAGEEHEHGGQRVQAERVGRVDVVERAAVEAQDEAGDADDADDDRRAAQRAARDLRDEEREDREQEVELHLDHERPQHAVEPAGALLVEELRERRVAPPVLGLRPERLPEVEDDDGHVVERQHPQRAVEEVPLEVDAPALPARAERARERRVEQAAAEDEEQEDQLAAGEQHAVLRVVLGREGERGRDERVGAEHRQRADGAQRLEASVAELAGLLDRLAQAAVSAKTGGRRSAHGAACSSCAATRSSTSSRP